MDLNDWRVTVAILAAAFLSVVLIALRVGAWIESKFRPGAGAAAELEKGAENRVAMNDAAYVIAVADPNPGVRLDALDYLDRRGGDKEPGYVRAFGNVTAWTTSAARVDALQKAQMARRALEAKAKRNDTPPAA